MEDIGDTVLGMAASSFKSRLPGDLDRDLLQEYDL